MGTFKKFNLIGGWLSFAIAAVVYLLTMEPTASLWDCAEFIGTSYKLEVGHPPGAPLFMLLGRFFMIFAGPEKAAVMANTMSALASAATIMFLFWSITHLARRSYKMNESQLSGGKMWAVLGAGFIGAMAYTFTDTFWFSAVEAEVYALSSLFTAVVFWCILKWENVADEPHANRWLILIAYLTGLAIGVHLLNLLIIPAIVLIYYFKKYPKVTGWGVTKSVLLSFLIIVFILYVIIPKTVQLGAFIDRVFVNSLGAKVNLGFTVYVLALFALMIWAVYYTHKKGKVLLNTIVLCFSVIMLGFSSYASVIIRASINPPMNSNNPGNPYGLLSLLNRDQYGSRPLLTGPYYSSPPVAVKTKTVYYLSSEDSTYVKAETVSDYEYAEGFKFFFPRMHERKESHVEAYHTWVDIKGKQIPFRGEYVTVPTFGENLQFFFSYQLNFMYWRYFLWNFVGRQSDVQSTGQITDGNWLSGIKPIDALFLGPQDDLPSEMANNKGRNKYFFLPFILGIMGLVFQLNRDGRNFSAVAVFFFMTGIAIAIYLNSPPVEPRERDYVFAGSFYAYAIWIGFGVLSIYNVLSRWLKKDGMATALIATGISLVVPVLLAAQNWDDHNRSGRYIARDFGHNYLNSTLPNSIVIDYGDNDTFPLWYAQEVEGIRTDVRVMNQSYLGGEWYIDQMKLKAYESDPVPFTIPQHKYAFVNETVDVVPITDQPILAKFAIDFFISDDVKTKQAYLPGRNPDCILSRTLAVPVNKENAIASGIVRAEDAHLMVDTIFINIQKNYVDRTQLMLIDLLANFDWKRPIYFTAVSPLQELGLTEYLQLDGFAYRLVPIKTPVQDWMKVGRIDSDYLYERLMNQFEYGGFNDPKVYSDYFSYLCFNSVQARNLFARLADEYTAKGDTTKAIEILDRSLEEIPLSQFRYSYVMVVPVVESYYKAGETVKGDELFDYAKGVLQEYMDYFLRFNGNKTDLVLDQFQYNFHQMVLLMQMAQNNGRYDKAMEIRNYLQSTGLVNSDTN